MDTEVAALRFLPLIDGFEALKFVRSARWPDRILCPQCGSHFVKAIQSMVVTELFKCQDCDYSFNSRSRTIMHGAKIKMNLVLQFIVFRDHLGTNSAPQEISRKLRVTEQTGRALRNKYLDLDFDPTYFVPARRASEAFTSALPDLESVSPEMADYFQRYRVCLDPGLFRTRLARVLARPRLDVGAGA